MKFVSIDFETANKNLASACSVGLVRIDEQGHKHEYYSLIRPPAGLDEFSHYNIGIHGITKDSVKDAPTFDELWPTIANFMEGQKLVAHNAFFDMNVLRESLKLYGAPPIRLEFACSYLLSKKYLDLLNFKLPTVYRELVGNEFEHHDALADAKASAEVILALAAKFNFETIEELVDRADMNFAVLDTSSSSGFNSMRRGRAVSYRRSEINSLQSTVDLSDVDSGNPCFGLEFVFTGTLTSMDRKTAQECVIKRGGKTGSSVTRSTNILVEGMQDPRQLVPGATHSRSYERAMRQREIRSNIEVIDEETFLGMLEG